MTFSCMVGIITEFSQAVIKEKSMVELLSRYCELIFINRGGQNSWGTERNHKREKT